MQERMKNYAGRKQHVEFKEKGVGLLKNLSLQLAFLAKHRCEKLSPRFFMELPSAAHIKLLKKIKQLSFDWNYHRWPPFLTCFTFYNWRGWLVKTTPCDTNSFPYKGLWMTPRTEWYFGVEMEFKHISRRVDFVARLTTFWCNVGRSKDYQATNFELLPWGQGGCHNTHKVGQGHVWLSCPRPCPLFHSSSPQNLILHGSSWDSFINYSPFLFFYGKSIFKLLTLNNKICLNRFRESLNFN